MNFLSELTGSFALPAAENPTVAMVEAAYRHHNLNWRYLNCEVPPDRLANAVLGARAMGWRGFNCSIPHKIAVIPYLDGLGESASIMQAVNCVVSRDGRYIGENTDGKGFVQSLCDVADPADKSIVMFGAGGAARAIGVETALVGARKITVVNRSVQRGRELVELLNRRTPTVAEYVEWNASYNVPADTDIVVNATSIGLFPDTSATVDINVESLLSKMVVADVIPNPPRTRFLQIAESRGCTTLDGLGMLVQQGVIGLQFWTGLTVDAAVMRETLREIFGC